MLCLISLPSRWQSLHSLWTLTTASDKSSHHSHAATSSLLAACAAPGPSISPPIHSLSSGTSSRSNGNTRRPWWTCSSGLYSNAVITAIKGLHQGWRLRLTDLRCLLSSSRTLIRLSSSESEGITKMNWVVFPLNPGCVFSLSTGGLLNKSISCQLHISGKQMHGFFSAALLSESVSYSWLIIEANSFQSFHSVYI